MLIMQDIDDPQVPKKPFRCRIQGRLHEFDAMVGWIPITEDSEDVPKVD